MSSLPQLAPPQHMPLLVQSRWPSFSQPAMSLSHLLSPSCALAVVRRVAHHASRPLLQELHTLLPSQVRQHSLDTNTTQKCANHDAHFTRICFRGWPLVHVGSWRCLGIRPSHSATPAPRSQSAPALPCAVVRCWPPKHTARPVATHCTLAHQPCTIAIYHAGCVATSKL